MNKQDRENAKNVWIAKQLEKQRVWQHLRMMKKVFNHAKRDNANG